MCRFSLSKLIFIPVAFFVLNALSFAQESSVLSSGQWVKMKFTESGIYKIDRSTLSEMGFDVSSIDPRNIGIFGNRGGMLPQPLSIERETDLHENPAVVKGEEDGVFNAEDYILFYVDNPNELTFNPQLNLYDWTKNLYSEEIYYFITIKNEDGLRIANGLNLGSNLPKITLYDQLIAHEKDIENILTSGREWFGESFIDQNPISFNFDIRSPAPNQEIGFQIKAMSEAYVNTSIEVKAEDQVLGELQMINIPNARYGVKANEQTRNFKLSTNQIADQTFNLQFEYDNAGQSTALARLNSFVISIPSELSFTNAQTPFNSRYATAGTSTFSIKNTNTEMLIWDVSNPVEAVNIPYQTNGTVATFGAFTDQIHEYIMFDAGSANSVQDFESINNQDLHGIAVPDLVIVSAPEFLSEAERLADFRRNHDGLTVVVTSPQEIYNEFSSGRQDITAIRDFMHYLKSKSDKLKYLLLFGKGSYDYKDRIEENTNFVPTYESRNSIHPLSTYSSDDYYGFLEETEGEWKESSSGDHTLDIGIGRIPSTTIEQAKTAVDKIISYQTAIKSIGDWRRRIVFVADDGDNNLHQRDADKLATLVDTSYADFNVRKIYLDDYEQLRNPNGETSPAAQKALLDAVEKGVLILNFTGHGAETDWMQEQVLTEETIQEWENLDKLPLVVTATCEFGRNDDPAIFSGAERLLLKSDGGAIAMVTTARPVFSSSNYNLNQALYESVLEKPEGKFQRLGDVIRYTKNNALNGANNRNFILLGDPSMRLSYPKNEIVITSLNGNIPDGKTDTLKALQKVRIIGQIESEGQLLQNFNGELNFSLYDKLTEQQTLGTSGDPFYFKERSSLLFNGKARVRNGQFRVEFVVPKNINYQYGQGKMSLYAYEKNSLEDAFGAKIDFTLGGTAENIDGDNLPPRINAFMNDSTAISPFIVKKDANLLLKLWDESGINISQSGIGQFLSATLNDSITYNLNDYFEAAIDDFTHGEVLFPLRNLPLGHNQIEVKVWDNHNNLAKSIVEFEVTGENSTIITEINSYPNPLVDQTAFKIAHNCAGEALEIVVDIINARGEKVTSIYSDIENASNTESLNWDGTNNVGAKLTKGIYVYNVTLRSKNSGKTHTKRKKLIISY